MDTLRSIVRLATDPRQASWLCPLLLLADAVLCGLIIWKVPYTEIDWVAYMQQVSQYLKGERNYYNIAGDTGPLVYPGLHVYIYRLLYALTGRGEDIFAAQCIFAGVYLGALGVVMACYRLAKAPPYIFPLLVLSKRLHSIFVLRLFNDCFAVLFLWAAIYSYQKRSWYIGTALLSAGIGTKMSVLLVTPAVALILLQAVGIEGSVTQGLIVVQTQMLFAYEFVRAHWKAYVGRAFQLNRQFLYKWTVNWRFVPEHIFLSSGFSNTLLGVHAGLLALFATTRWTKPAGRSLPATLSFYFSDPDWRTTESISERVMPDFVLTSILTANAIGMLCARSLHYQFFAWTAWATPWLLWRTGFHPIMVVGIWAAQEWAWNVYPSTDFSSQLAVACLAMQVNGIWWGTRKEKPAREEAETKKVN